MSGPRSVMMRSSSHGVSLSLAMSNLVLQQPAALEKSQGPVAGSRRLGNHPALPMFWNVTVPPFEGASSSPGRKGGAPTLPPLPPIPVPPVPALPPLPALPAAPDPPTPPTPPPEPLVVAPLVAPPAPPDVEALLVPLFPPDVATVLTPPLPPDVATVLAAPPLPPPSREDSVVHEPWSSTLTRTIGAKGRAKLTRGLPS
jgi:hypothetical protein